MIPFNKPYITGKETKYIKEAFAKGKISGDGFFTFKCQDFFEQRFGFKKVLLTTSCTDALEMAAILLDIQPGDEVIAPSFTFVSTVNPFVLRGAKIIFIDCKKDHPSIDENAIESLITPKTKVIIPVHYAGFSCDMDKIMEIANKYKLFVVEDAAQAIDNFHIGKDGIKKPLGSIGHLAAFSFHETKNIISGEGGMLVINDLQFLKRAEIIREKGTNRSQFFRGEVNKYNWKDIGSSFLPSDILAAFLWAQLAQMENIKVKRLKIWNSYQSKLKKLDELGYIRTPKIPLYSANNGHLFYLQCRNIDERTKLINFLKASDISAIFHYISLHSSDYYIDKHDGRQLINTDEYTNTLLRLPLYIELKQRDVNRIISKIYEFFNL
jgi:dTDP-4-amino-4,6-dideoxygalactose transaminase